MNTIKSIFAVIAGFLTVALLSTITDTLLEKVGVFPSLTTGSFSTGLLALALLYRSIYAVVGGYVVARLAPSNAQRHVIILGILGIIGGVIGVIFGWNLSAHWYPIALAVTAFPLVWFGGKLAK